MAMVYYHAVMLRAIQSLSLGDMAMEKKSTHFLNVSLVLVSLFCVFIFICQTVCINLMGEDAIGKLGVFYISGISEQVASHFGTIIELRLSQVESLVDAVPPGRYTGGSSMQIELAYNARSAGFEYLALYTEDGDFHMIYGAQVTADVPESLYRSVQGGNYNICAGTDETGTPVVLMGVPAIYTMDDGSTSSALVAGLPTSYLGDMLEDSIQSDTMEYAIIRDDGSYVVHNTSAIDAENYFERVASSYESCDGKTPGQYVEELCSAIEADRDYSSEVLIAGETWNIYCTSLPNSEWHMLLKTSHNTVNDTVTLLRKRWSYISIGGCSLIICALLFVFVGYYRLSRMQMKELNEARKNAEQANKAKNEFLSNMSHDIRTPMNGIMGMTSIAIDSLDNPPRVRSCLKKIHVSSRHLLGLITDMLDMSKIESGNLTLHTEPVSLREIMQNIMTIIQPQVQEKNQQFHIYIHDIYHENVCTDRVRLSQILLNMLGNAVKFTPEGGRIEIDLYEEPSPRGEEYIRSVLYIKDTGIGMSEEFQKIIFEAFAREDSARVDKAAGAGMGMAITKYIVDTMGGSITVESERGKGSCFRIALDMEKAAGQEKELQLPERNVLVIDDDETAGAIAVSALRSIGLRAQSAADIRQAIQMIDTRQGTEEAFHMILMDHDIQGDDGVQAARELSVRLASDVPILLFVEGESDELEARVEEAGISGVISKPLFRSVLYYVLRPFTGTPVIRQEEKEEDKIDLKGKRILIAEDNELNWEIASEMLNEFGIESEWAENGQICVEMFQASAPGQYDAILMDLRMPVMTGFEAAVAIRKLARADARTVPIIAASADAFQDDIQKCLDCGMNVHTAKPLELQKILALLNQYLS